jgi:type I restriction enzyme, S subunit
MGGGLRQSMKYGDIKRMPLVIPTKAEQSEIASFLDHETAKIDVLIAEQQRLIELLQEKRQALISHAVTKGLNPNAPMKDSGVEWLGEVPEHWRQTPIKRIAKIFGRIGFRGYTVDDIVSEGEGAIALAPGNLKERGFSLEKKTHISWAKYEESPEIKIEKNDVLLVKTGSTYGKCCFVDNLNEPATLNPQMVVFKETSIERELLFYILMSSHIQAEIKNLNKGSALPTVTQEGIGSIEIFAPPRNEQLQMIEHIKDKEARLFALIDQSESSMRLLLERRSALISAAVTGQIDARELVEAGGSEQ